MNYDDLLWKCQGILSSQDYMRLAGLIAAERELRAQQTQNSDCTKILAQGKKMIRWYWDSVMQRLGYRKVWYHPSDHGVALGDFWSWHYRPDLPKGVYNGEKMSGRSW